MAEKRMFSKTIVSSDAFTDMSLSTQALYFHLGMRADDDGFVDNPKSILRMIGASNDDLKLLFAKGFIIPFESGVCVVRHWKIHNYIPKDRYHETLHREEKDSLKLNENNEYLLMDTTCIQPVYKMDTEIRLDKIRLNKNKLNICSELQAASEQHGTATVENAVIFIPLNDGSEYGITEDQVSEWSELYPAVDVLQELRKMRGWSEANPKQRKTGRGILRHINGWLAKAQDRSGYSSNNAAARDTYVYTNLM